MFVRVYENLARHSTARRVAVLAHSQREKTKSALLLFHFQISFIFILKLFVPVKNNDVT